VKHGSHTLPSFQTQRLGLKRLRSSSIFPSVGLPAGAPRASFLLCVLGLSFYTFLSLICILMLINVCVRNYVNRIFPRGGKPSEEEEERVK